MANGIIQFFHLKRFCNGYFCAGPNVPCSALKLNVKEIGSDKTFEVEVDNDATVGNVAALFNAQNLEFFYKQDEMGPLWNDLKFSEIPDIYGVLIRNGSTIYVKNRDRSSGVVLKLKAQEQQEEREKQEKAKEKLQEKLDAVKTKLTSLKNSLSTLKTKLLALKKILSETPEEREARLEAEKKSKLQFRCNELIDEGNTIIDALREALVSKSVEQAGVEFTKMSKDYAEKEKDFLKEVPSDKTWSKDLKDQLNKQKEALAQAWKQAPQYKKDIEEKKARLDKQCKDILKEGDGIIANLKKVKDSMKVGHDDCFQSVIVGLGPLAYRNLPGSISTKFQNGYSGQKILTIGLCLWAKAEYQRTKMDEEIKKFSIKYAKYIFENLDQRSTRFNFITRIHDEIISTWFKPFLEALYKKKIEIEQAAINFKLSVLKAYRDSIKQNTSYLQMYIDRNNIKRNKNKPEDENPIFENIGKKVLGHDDVITTINNINLPPTYDYNLHRMAPQLDNPFLLSICRLQPNINFIGEVSTDAGGPRREFISLFAHTFISKPFFNYVKSDTWQTPGTDALSGNEDAKKAYRAFGRIMALAFMNKLPVGIPLSEASWMYFCNQFPDLEKDKSPEKEDSFFEYMLMIKNINEAREAKTNYEFYLEFAKYGLAHQFDTFSKKFEDQIKMEFSDYETDDWTKEWKEIMIKEFFQSDVLPNVAKKALDEIKYGFFDGEQKFTADDKEQAKKFIGFLVNNVCPYIFKNIDKSDYPEYHTGSLRTIDFSELQKAFGENKLDGVLLAEFFHWLKPIDFRALFPTAIDADALKDKIKYQSQIFGVLTETQIAAQEAFKTIFKNYIEENRANGMDSSEVSQAKQDALAGLVAHFTGSRSYDGRDLKIIFKDNEWNRRMSKENYLFPDESHTCFETIDVYLENIAGHDQPNSTTFKDNIKKELKQWKGQGIYIESVRGFV